MHRYSHFSLLATLTISFLLCGQEMVKQETLTPLMLACKAENPASVKLLLDAGANIRDKDSRNQDAFVQTLERYTQSITLAQAQENVSRLLATVTALSYLNLLPRELVLEVHKCMQQTVSDDCFAVLTLLLTHPATQAHKNLMVSQSINGSTPLILACNAGKETVIRLLVTAGAPIDGHDGNGISALIHAINRGDFAMIELLLSLDADVTDQCGADNMNALIYAIEKGDQRIFTKILARYPNNHFSHDGHRQTPLTRAIKKATSNRLAEYYEPDYRVIGQLLDHGIEVRREDFNAAIKADDVNLLDLILEHRNVASHRKQLLNPSAVYFAHTYKLETAPILYGARYGTVAMVEFLIAQGVDLTALTKSIDGWIFSTRERSATDIARAVGNVAVADFLEEFIPPAWEQREREAQSPTFFLRLLAVFAPTAFSIFIARR